MNTTKLVLRACAIGVTILALAAPSRAAILYTAPAETGQGKVPGTMWCALVNTSSSPITVTMDGLNYKGEVVDSSGELVVAAGAGPTRGLSNGSIYCRFTVSTSVKRVVAGAFYSRSSDDKLVSFVPAQ